MAITDVYIDPDYDGGSRDGSPDAPYWLSDLRTLGFSGSTRYLIKQGTTSYLGGEYVNGYVNATNLGAAHEGIIFDIWEEGGSTLPIISGMRDLKSETWIAGGQANGENTWYVANTDTLHITAGKPNERVYFNNIAAGQVDAFANMTSERPVFFDDVNKRLYVRSSVSPATFPDNFIQTCWYQTKLFSFLNTDGVYINNIEGQGAHFIGEYITSNITTFELDGCSLTKTAINDQGLFLFGSIDYNISGFVLKNSPQWGRALELYEDIDAGATPSASYPYQNNGSSNMIQLNQNVGLASGGTPGDGAIIRNNNIYCGGHTAVELTCHSYDAANIVRMRNILVEGNTYNGGNSNHARPISINGYNCNDVIVRNETMIGTNTQCQIGTAFSEFYNILFKDTGADPLNSVTDPFFGACWTWLRAECNTATYPDCDRPPLLQEICQGNILHSVTFKNTEACPISMHSGGYGWGSTTYIPNQHRNIVFDNCNTSSPDNVPSGVVVNYWYGGSEAAYNVQSAQLFSNCVVYNSGITSTDPIVRMAAPTSPWAPTTYSLSTLPANHTNFSIQDPELDASTFTPATTGSAYDAGYNVGTSYDIYYNIRPGAGSNVYDIGAVEQQGYPVVFVSPTGSDSTGTGSQLNPFKSLDHATSVAVGAVTPGTTVMMRGGTHTTELASSGTISRHDYDYYTTTLGMAVGDAPGAATLANAPNVEGLESAPITVMPYNDEEVFMSSRLSFDVDNWIVKGIKFIKDAVCVSVGWRDDTLKITTSVANLDLINCQWLNNRIPSVLGVLQINGVDGMNITGCLFDNIRAGAAGQDGAAIDMRVAINNLYVANNRFIDIGSDGMIWNESHSDFVAKSFTNILVEYNDFTITKPYVPRDGNGDYYSDPWPSWAGYVGENGIDVKWSDSGNIIRYNKFSRFRPTTTGQDASSADGDGIVIHRQTSGIEVYGNSFIDCQRSVSQGAAVVNGMDVDIHSNYIKSLPAGERADEVVPITDDTVYGIRTGTAGYTMTAEIYNNTVDLSDIPSAVVINHINASTDIEVTNNVFLGGAGSSSSSSAAVTADYNYWGANVTRDPDHLGANDLTEGVDGAPDLHDSGAPLSSSPLIGAGTTLTPMGDDVEGFSFSDPPNIGCFAQRTPVAGDYIAGYSLRRKITSG